MIQMLMIEMRCPSMLHTLRSVPDGHLLSSNFVHSHCDSCFQTIFQRYQSRRSDEKDSRVFNDFSDMAQELSRGGAIDDAVIGG